MSARAATSMAQCVMPAKAEARLASTTLAPVSRRQAVLDAYRISAHAEAK